MARRPAAQISRLWVQASGSSSQMPASVGSLPALLDRGGGDLGRPPAVGVEVVVAGGRGEQQQRLAERVELKLLVDPVADDVGAAGVARQVELALVGHRAAVDGVGGLQLRAVGEQAFGHEPHRVVHQRVRAGLGDRLPGEALVADPDVAVVVVAALRGRARAATSSPPRPSRRPALVRPDITA